MLSAALHWLNLAMDMEVIATEVGAAMELTVDMVAMAEVMEVTAIMGRDPQKLKQGMATVAMVDIAQEVMEVMVAMEGMATMERGLPLLSQQP